MKERGVIPFLQPGKDGAVHLKRVESMEIKDKYTILRLPGGKRVKVKSGVVIYVDVVTGNMSM